MNIYSHLDYRTALTEIVAERKKSDPDLSFVQLSKAIRLEKTYVSKVLNGRADFNSDQMYAVCRFLGLNEQERDYLLLLLEYQRSGHPLRKKELKARITLAQSEHLSTRKYLRARSVNQEAKDRYLEYYLEPLAPVVHTYLSIPEYQKNTGLLRDRLGLKEAEVQRILKLLIRLEIVKIQKEPKAYLPVVNNIQLAKDSPVCLPSEVLFRLHVIEHVRKLPAEQRFLLSLSFSGDEETRNFIHAEFLKFLKVAEAAIRAAPSEKVFQMNFDLFPWDVV
ncbi:MAG: TIGR02147 family protein [Oligoflexia bacterium]|nr:TIGR02147 family protein [Oligoflexia bacterium]